MRNVACDGKTGTAKLLFNATGLNRGRLWVNGHDAGRYFLQPRNDASACPSPSPGICTDPSACVRAFGP